MTSESGLRENLRQRVCEIIEAAIERHNPGNSLRHTLDDADAIMALISPAGEVAGALGSSLRDTHRAPSDGGSGSETWESIAAWQRETFGPVSLERQVQRAAEEMDELLLAPDDASEAADVCIVLAGYPGIREAIDRKMAVNRARKWRLNGDGTGYHVKATPTASPAQSGHEGEAEVSPNIQQEGMKG